MGVLLAEIVAFDNKMLVKLYFSTCRKPKAMKRIEASIVERLSIT